MESDRKEKMTHCNTCGRFTEWPQRKCQSCVILANMIDEGRSIFSVEDRHDMIVAAHNILFAAWGMDFLFIPSLEG
jgi:hypothetical protein